MSKRRDFTFWSLMECPTSDRAYRWYVQDKDDVMIYGFGRTPSAAIRDARKKVRK